MSSEMKSFENLLDEIKKIGKPNAELTLLGTKCDMKNKKVDYFEAKVEIEYLCNWLSRELH